MPTHPSKFLLVALPCLLSLSVAACSSPVHPHHVHSHASMTSPAQSPHHQLISARLDELHSAAARADESAYFACFTSDAVFLGTDASERWTIDQFRAYAHPHFSAGRGWSYTPLSRHISLAPSSPSSPNTFPNASVAWFDELLSNAKYGTCRGSGVLARDQAGTWRIAQYNLSVPIPNDLLPDIARQIRDHAGNKQTPHAANPPRLDD